MNTVEIGELSLQDSARLRRAISIGDWNGAMAIFETLRGGFSVVTENKETLLHLALRGKNDYYVDEIINRMDPSQLELADCYKNNALIHAVIMGNLAAASKMLSKNPGLINKEGSDNQKPLEKAVVYGQLKMAEYLHHLLGRVWENEDQLKVICASLNFGSYDFALSLLYKCRHLDGKTIVGILKLLAEKPNLFLNGLFQRFQTYVFKRRNTATIITELLWQKFLEGSTVDGENIKECTDIFFAAAKSGNDEYLKLLLSYHPHLLHYQNQKGKSLFGKAIIHRRNSILNLLSPKFFKKHMLVFMGKKQKENILICAAKCKSKIDGELSCPAIELAHKMLLFNEMENLVKDKTDSTNPTHRKTFMTNHKDMLERAQKWIVDTCNGSLIVAALNTNILFNSSYFSFITGQQQENRQDYLIRYFVGAHGFITMMSFFSTITFFSLLTSRCTFKDFILSIPMRLFLGFFFLLVSGSYILWTFISVFALTHCPSLKPIPLITGTAIVSCIPWFLYKGLLKDLLCLLGRSVMLGGRRRW